MTTLVLGAVGGVIGGMLGGPVGAQIGFLAGSLLGSLLDPPKIQGPRLGDTKLQKSTYGAMLPYCWGAGRLGTIIIDQTDLVEHENTTDAGKGGSETTNFTYTASWLAGLCMRLPNQESAIAGISHLFLDGRLVWAADSDGDCPCEVYTGTEAQDPDADFEAINGVGKQPGYRGMAYLKFKDFSLTDFGNRIPNVEAVVFTNGVEGDFPTRVGDEFPPWGGDTPANPYLNKAGFTSTYNGGLITTSWTFRNTGGWLEIWVAQYLLSGTVIMIPNLVWSGPSPSVLYYQPSHTGIHQWFYNGPGPGDFGWLKLFYSVGTTPNGNYAQVSQMKGWSVADNDDVVALTAFPNGQAAAGIHIQATKQGIIYYPARLGSNPCVIAKSEQFPLGTVWKQLADLDPDGGLYSPNDVNMGLGTDDQTVYASVSFGGQEKLWRFGGRGDYFWDVSDTSGTQLRGMSDFFVYQNRWIVFCKASNVYIVQINQDETLEDVGTPLVQGIGGQSCDYLGSIYGLDKSGVFKLGNLGGGPVLLSQIVDDLASLTPASAYDNAELTDEVRWYLLASQMPVRNALDKLRQSFFFDIVEVDYTLTAYKRGDRTVYTIPDDDLDGREYGEDPGDPLRTDRKREQELPRTVTMTYIDVDLDWQTGAQSSPRQVTQSQYDVSLEMPIGFTAQESAQKCWSIQVAAWMEREMFKWTSSREYSWLTPAMVAKVRGRDVRITSVTESPLTGVLSFEGVANGPSIYTQVAPGAPSQGGQGSQGGPSGSGSGPAGSPGSGGSGGGGGNPGDPGVRPPPPGTGIVDPFQYFLIDCPALHPTDSPFGFYMAVSQVYGLYYWGGADLYRSDEFGETFTFMGTKKGSSVIGSLVGPGPIGSEPTLPATVLDASYSGGDVTQEVSVYLWLANPLQALTSTTEAGLDSGANLIFMSEQNVYGNPLDPTLASMHQKWECMQFRDVLPLAHNYYKVTGWRRGRRGTALLNHSAITASSWFAPETVSPIIDVEANLNRTYTYKVVPYGYTTLQVGSVQFTNYGEAGGGSNAGGGSGGGTTTPGGGNTPGNGSFDTIALNFPITVQVKTSSYTLVPNDRASLMVFNSASSGTFSLDPSTLPKKWWCFIENVGAGTLTLDPVGGSPVSHLDTVTTSLSVTTNQGLLLVFDGTDFWTSRGMGSGGGTSPAGGITDGDYGDLVISGSGTVWTIDAGVVTNAKLANMAAHTFKARKTNSTGSPEDATATEATALLDAFTGADVGSPSAGGVKGLVPAPSVGNGDARKFLMADGTWAVPYAYKVLMPAYAATVTVDLTPYSMYAAIQVDVGVLTGGITLNITNGANGQIIRVRLKQDGTGGRLLSAGGSIATSATELPLPLLSTAANAIDLLAFVWDGTSAVARLVAYVRGFA